MGVRPGHHRRGIGRRLVALLEERPRAEGRELLAVRTLSPSHPSPEYAHTRAFHASVGFRPLEELPPPCRATGTPAS